MLHIQYSPYIRDIHYESANDFIRAISYDGELYELFNEHHTVLKVMVPQRILGTCISCSVPRC